MRSSIAGMALNTYLIVIALQCIRVFFPLSFISLFVIHLLNLYQSTFS